MTLLAERPTRQAMTHTRPPEFRLRSEMQFAALPTAVVCAQLFVTYALDAWRLDALVPAAHDIATKLVMRAVRTTGITDPHPRRVELDDLKLIVVRLLVIEQRLIIEVADSDPTFDLSAEGGGLDAVPRLCRRWNYYAAKTGGKVVWGELLLSTSAPALDQMQELALSPLPKRVPNREPVDPIEVMDDPGMLRRVCDGLRAIDDDSPGGDDMR
ncbi:hypothetical protein [Frankia sp. Cas4]|uniref:hypothetical protein n=1 Tax=Frankia sp. Cas4 TaxID=3073927 RepID=UPI002AD28A88|nr:hypothetical protein [Frankia sp. Cas4]